MVDTMATTYTSILGGWLHLPPHLLMASRDSKLHTRFAAYQFHFKFSPPGRLLASGMERKTAGDNILVDFYISLLAPAGADQGSDPAPLCAAAAGPPLAGKPRTLCLEARRGRAGAPFGCAHVGTRHAAALQRRRTWRPLTVLP